ncbi:peptide ABC transporter substrate-binding protein [Paenibacillus sp. GCM10012306]|uniref:peptide ABC transporter substrate-binding protein n=1 Tax=Paenibacillus sp. GCM10012306 TaxID=3317342 RepID=UPI003609EB16
MKKWLYVCLCISLLMSLGVGKEPVASAAKTQQVFRIGVEHLPQSLDPALAEPGSSNTIVKGLFEGLVRLNNAGQAVPGMAEKWTLSDDGRTYTFTLRSAAKWSNQQPVKASDFEYAWKRVLAPSADNLYAPNFFVIAGAEDYNSGQLKDPAKIGIKALNNNTLQVKLTQKTPSFLQLLAHSIFLPVHADTVKGNKNWGNTDKTMVTNGPFKLKSWDDNEAVLVKNPDYYLAQETSFSEVRVVVPRISLDRINAVTSAYLMNDVDWVGGEENIDYEGLDNKTSRDLIKMPYGSTYFYQFNLNKAPFKNLKIRKALAMAIDREALPYGTPAYGFVAPGIRGTKTEFRSEIPDTAYFKENLAQAGQLLKEGLKEEGLKVLPSFSILINEGDMHKSVAQAIIGNWKKNLGINASIEVKSFVEMIDKRWKGNYSIARAGWSASFNDPETFLEYFTSWSDLNYSGWNSPQYDNYIKQAQQTFDIRKRMQLLANAEKVLIDQMVILPLYYYVVDVLRKPDIKNVYIDYDRSVIFSRGYFL